MNVHDLFVIDYCEAHGASTDRRCTREATTWSHVYVGTGEPFPAGRLYLCWQHAHMVERYVRRGTATKHLALWQGLLQAPPE